MNEATWAALATVAGAVVSPVGDGSGRLSCLVAGEPVDGEDAMLQRTSPATGHPLYEYQEMTAAQLSEVIAQVRIAHLESWWRQPAERGRVLLRAADGVELHSDLLVALIVAETGKPIREAQGEVGAVVNAFRYFGGAARDVTGRTYPNLDPHRFAMTVKEPAGLAALIVPWNFPIAVLTQKLAPALAAGCGVVIKPSPLAALSPLVLAAIVIEAGVPGGVVNVVLGGEAAGQALVEHADVDVVSFTGSSAVGRIIAATAGTNRLKKVAIEAGGNAAAIVMDDADVEEAARGLTFGSLFNQGECCVATGRVLVQERLIDALVDALAKRMGRVRLGDPYDPETQLGPMISDAHCANVLQTVHTAAGNGAQIIAGGTQVRRGDLPGGPYLEPTLIVHPDQASRLVQEEVFGPVITVQSFHTDDDALRLANDTKYGLGASIWTNSLNRALVLSQSVRAGNVWINGSIESFPELPISGRRDSGFAPEFGREGLEFFSEVRTIQLIGEPTTVALPFGD